MIELARRVLLLELENSHIEYLFLSTIAMPFDHQQPMSVGHHEKERRESIAVRAGLFQCLI